MPHDEETFQPDWSEVHRLEEATMATDWPDAWLTPSDFMKELDRRDFWTDRFAMMDEQGRAQWLANIFEGCMIFDEDGTLRTPVFPHLRKKFRHHETITDPLDHMRLAHEYTRAMNQRFGMNAPMPCPEVD